MRLLLRISARGMPGKLWAGTASNISFAGRNQKARVVNNEPCLFLINRRLFEMASFCTSACV